VKGLLIFLAITLLICKDSNGQVTDKKRNSLLAYPVLFRLPETRWGIGIASSYQFYINKTDSISPSSQVQFGLAYTQNKQSLIYLPYSFWWDERRNNLSGELGYYDYSYNFFGVGFDSDASIEENYQVSFPRFRGNYLRQIIPNYYLGTRWWYEDYRITKTLEGGQLAADQVPGSQSSTTSGPGFVFVFDNRDNIFETRQGYFLELVWHNQSRITGSNFWYDRYRFDIRKFIPLGKRNSLAIQGFGDFLRGSVPFSQMASIGGSKRMRGFYEGHFRDKNMLMLQMEARIKVYKRWGITTFAHGGVLANERMSFAINYTHPAAGLGIRYMFDNEKRLNVRLDYAVSSEARLFYFTVGEAF